MAPRRRTLTALVVALVAITSAVFGIASAHLSQGAAKSRDDAAVIDAVTIRRPKTVSRPTADPQANLAHAVSLPRAGGVVTAPRDETLRGTVVAPADAETTPLLWLGRVPARGPPH